MGRGSIALGGKNNSAAGAYSLVAGQGSFSTHNNTFVWNADSTSAFSTTADRQFLVRAPGGVGINTNTPANALEVVGTISGNSVTSNGISGTSGSAIASGVYGDNTFSGYGVAGRTSGIGSAIYGDNTSPTGFAGYFNGNVRVIGNLCATGTIGACSDARFKTDVEQLSHSLDNILKMRGVAYHWKRNEFPERRFDENLHVGFIAQEVEQIYPEMVITERDGYKSVDYARLTPVLVEAIKEQQATIRTMTERIEKVEATLNKLAQSVPATNEQLVTK